MTTLVETRPVPRAAARPTYLSELKSTTTSNVPTVVFMYVEKCRNSIWSYVGRDNKGNTIFKNSGGGIFVPTDSANQWTHALDGLSQLVQELSKYDGSLLYINNQRLSSMFKEAFSASQNITVIDSRPTDIVLQARKLISKEGDRLTGRVILVTDAAVKGEHAGIGWLLSYKKLNVNVYGESQTIRLTPKSSDSLTAELMAIRSGVEGTLRRLSSLKLGWGSLTIKSDSMGAINLINQIRDGVPNGKLIAGSRQHTIAREISDMLIDVDVKLVWVKGHNGNEMNEYCDRLAVAARRSSEYGVSNEKAKEISDGIVGDAYSVLRNRRFSTLF